MSADNWAICPRCRRREEDRIAALHAQAAASYGSVSADEYEILRAEAAKPIDLEALRTFREDYEIYGAEQGQLSISYGGACDKCGLRHDFNYGEPFTGLADPE